MMPIVSIYGDSLLCVLKNLGVRSWPKYEARVTHFSVSFRENKPSASNGRVL